MIQQRCDTPEPTRTAWIDARAGVAGDMLLAALLDAGADLATVRRDVAAVLGDAVTLETHTTSRGGQRATLLDVQLRRPDQHHRSWATIRTLLEQADLPTRVRDRSLATFDTLAAAEAQVHGHPVEEIHFHEVGAWDSIADIVGVCSALEDLHIDTLTTTEITLGDGTVRGAHGTMPVPPPAVARLLLAGKLTGRALPAGHTPGGEPVGELATPTGVALLVALTDRCTGQGTDTLSPIRAIGVGAGHKETQDWANVVRVIVGDTTGRPHPASPTDHAGHASPAGQAGHDGDGGLIVTELHILEANVDDLDPRAWPAVLETLLRAGALDAWLTPIIMKKGRPAHTLAALVDSGDDAHRLDTVRRAILTHTTTLGVRERTTTRTCLPRTFTPVTVTAGEHRAQIPVKVAHLDGTILQATPEYDDCAALAARSGRPVAEVLTAAAAAAHAAGLRPGVRVSVEPTAPGEDRPS